MLKFSLRRLFVVLVTTVLGAVATVAVSTAPAHAAVSGDLLAKGSGSVYSQSSVVNQGVVPGAAPRSWSFKIVNTGTQAEQFKVVKGAFSTGATATLYRGSTVLPNRYFTTPIAPGGSLVLTLKVSVVAGMPQGDYYGLVELRDPDTNVLLDSIYADANATYQTGNTQHDLFVKSGTQPYVGGSFMQYTSSNALKPGNSATFLLRVQNNGPTGAAISLSGPTMGCSTDFAWTVKQGTKDVTAAVLNGTYSTGPLAPGGRRDLKLWVKLLNPSSCTASYFRLAASGVDGSVAQNAHVLIAG